MPKHILAGDVWVFVICMVVWIYVGLRMYKDK